ncbi:hypothetical protein JCGZ_12687 [Jatropha curcas]|uniref:Uncharacterized protein n=1 Tax=Jatropha curcas TaxID=180498 RepID=A0A067KDV0_JATCU|nr:hypothetical protein JCGZ_12687 [Jatropha curcas]
MTRQFNWGAVALSYLYYSMNLYVRGAHLKVDYRRAIEIWACEHRVLLMLTLHGFDAETSIMTLPQGWAWKFGQNYAYTTPKISVFRHLLNDLSWDRQQRGKPDTAIIVGKPKHKPGASFSFILDRISQTTQGMLETHLVSPYRMSPLSCTHVSIADYNEAYDMDPPPLINESMENNIGDPLVLSSGPITRSRAKRYGASMSLYVQEQVTQKLYNLAFNKCCVELEGTPKLLTLLEANVGLFKTSCEEWCICSM